MHKMCSSIGNTIHTLVRVKSCRVCAQARIGLHKVLGRSTQAFGYVGSQQMSGLHRQAKKDTEYPPILVRYLGGVAYKTIES